MNYSTIDRYLLNIRNRLDLRRLWFVSVNKTKTWLEQNLSLIGIKSGQRFGGGLQSLTKEVDTDSRIRGWGPEGDEVIYGTGVFLNDGNLTFRFGAGFAIKGLDYSYPPNSTFNQILNTFSFEDEDEDVGMSHSFTENSAIVPVSRINSFVSVDFVGAGYPYRIIAAANPLSLYNTINYIRDNPVVTDLQFLPLAYGKVEYTEESMNFVLSEISPLIITNTVGW